MAYRRRTVALLVTSVSLEVALERKWAHSASAHPTGLAGYKGDFLALRHSRYGCAEGPIYLAVSSYLDPLAGYGRSSVALFVASNFRARSHGFATTYATPSDQV